MITQRNILRVNFKNDFSVTISDLPLWTCPILSTIHINPPIKNWSFSLICVACSSHPCISTGHCGRSYKRCWQSQRRQWTLSTMVEVGWPNTIGIKKTFSCHPPVCRRPFQNFDRRSQSFLSYSSVFPVVSASLMTIQVAMALASSDSFQSGWSNNPLRNVCQWANGAETMKELVLVHFQSK